MEIEQGVEQEGVEQKKAEQKKAQRQEWEAEQTRWQKEVMQDINNDKFGRPSGLLNTYQSRYSHVMYNKSRPFTFRLLGGGLLLVLYTLE